MGVKYVIESTGLFVEYEWLGSVVLGSRGRSLAVKVLSDVWFSCEGPDIWICSEEGRRPH